MNLSELQQEVYVLTLRPDLVPLTLLAVRSATLKIHQSDYFFKDIREYGIDFGDSTYTQQLDYRSLFPRWRSLKYLRKTDSAGSDGGAFFELIVPEHVNDSYGVQQTNVCYMAGAYVQIKSSTPLQYAIVGFYENPDVSEAGYSSWVALDHPYAIVFEAASAVFKAIGDTEQSAAYNALALQHLAEVKMSNIEARGY